MTDLLMINNTQATKYPMTAKVIANTPLSKDVYEISLDCKEIAGNSIPGQFVSILCENLTLRRPFSIANVDNNTIKIIYKLKGDGTRYISKLKDGQEVNLIGPLGKGFNIIPENSLLIGAGVGIAPVLFLSKELEKRQVPYRLLAGFQTLTNLTDLDRDKSLIITEDGSSGYQGRIIDYLKDEIIENKPQKIYSCGPEIVLKQVIDMANEYNIPVEVALEKKFACGIGVCMGCNVQIKENNTVKSKRICNDGPVFEGGSIVW